jgi:hypothetical protein
MSGELDANAVVAKFIQQNIEAFVDTAAGIIKIGADKLRLHLDRTYKNYLIHVFEKYSKAKSFLLRGEPSPLYQFYVPLDLRTQKSIFKSPALKDIQQISRYAIITGSAGCGKSMMMRHLLLNSIVAKDKVPIFLELRQFNSTDSDLDTLISQVLRVSKFTLDKDYIEKAFVAGHFVLFLDGYDEVVTSKRAQVTQYIHDFVKMYEKNIVIMSSRPDSELDGWQDFCVMQIQPMSLEQAFELVNKVPYDDDLKKKFLADLRLDLFKKHESFLSNPLLLSIMLLTYGQSANIPNKLNVFYNQAYEALFERHDALKGGYKRDRLTTLDIQDFGRIFAAFCLQAYDKRHFEFTRIQALDYIEKSQQITGLKCRKDDYLKDLIQAVCLLVEEGLQLVYSHRSFQEYFAARFIADARADIQKQLIKKYARVSRNDNVFHLLYEMRPDVIDQNYLIPGIDHIFNAIEVKKDIGETNYIKYMKQAFSGISLHGDRIGLTSNKQSHLFVDLAVFALNHCGHLVGWTGIDRSSKDEKIALIKKYLGTSTDARIKFDTCPYTDTLLRDFSKMKSFFSIEMLVALQKIGEALKQKKIMEEESLEAILSNKPAL